MKDFIVKKIKLKVQKFQSPNNIFGSSKIFEKTSKMKKNSNYANVFLSNLAIKLWKHNNFNNYAIKPVNNKQLFYELIHNLELVKLKVFKTCTKIYLKTGFIWAFKSFAYAFILFD